MLASVVWLHVNNCCKGSIAFLSQVGGKTGEMLCHQTGGPKTGWAYRREGAVLRCSFFVFFFFF